VADPPLKQVVSHTYEAGLRGGSDWNGGRVSWNASLFRTDSDNDIVALASAIQGRGFFANVPSTRRQGIDLTGRFEAERWSAYASHSYLDATYEFTGALASPNNPFADSDGNIFVTSGDRIPLNPPHHARIGGDVEILPGFSLGGDVLITGSQYYAGDDANQNEKLPAYWVLNLRGSYHFSERWEAFALIKNVFDRHDATYGTFFDPDGTSGLLNPPLTDPRTLTLARPISFQIGFSARL
jgi:iron complex outermembrane receptor protein